MPSAQRFFMPEFVQVGQIVGAHGIKGQVKVTPLTEYLERLDKGARIHLKGDWIEVESSTVHKGRLLLKLAGVETMTQAQALQWEYLEAAPIAAPEMEDDEYLVTDLEGMRVVTTAGRELGEVDEVLAYPAQDILRIGDLMIPAVKEFVKDIDLEGRVITVELIPGMLPDETPEEA